MKMFLLVVFGITSLVFMTVKLERAFNADVIKDNPVVEKPKIKRRQNLPELDFLANKKAEEAKARRLENERRHRERHLSQGNYNSPRPRHSGFPVPSNRQMAVADELTDYLAPSARADWRSLNRTQKEDAVSTLIAVYAFQNKVGRKATPAEVRSIQYQIMRK